jgi:hypothetical protein
MKGTVVLLMLLISIYVNVHSQENSISTTFHYQIRVFTVCQHDINYLYNLNKNQSLRFELNNYVFNTIMAVSKPIKNVLLYAKSRFLRFSRLTWNVLQVLVDRRSLFYEINTNKIMFDYLMLSKHRNPVL